MSTTPDREVPITRAVAAAMLAVKAVLGLWAAIVVFSASATRTRRFLGQVVHRRLVGAGVLLLLLVAATVVVAAGLVLGLSWARIAAFVLEGAAAVVALSRLGTRPGAAVVSLLLSAVVVALLLVPPGAGRRATPPASAAVPPV
ncbi:MAG: hypothetical protein ABR511_00615 [Acidimicrobiales bacterium]